MDKKMLRTHLLKLNLGMMALIVIMLLIGFVDTVSFFLFTMVLLFCANAGTFMGYYAVNSKKYREKQTLK